MQFRKLFTGDNDQFLRPRHRLGSDYLEGRGLYPEKRENIASRAQHDRRYEVRVDHSSVPQSDYEHWDSDRTATRRRMPLTTLDALVQIKENGLSHA